jgi:hypothetical protein
MSAMPLNAATSAFSGDGPTTSTLLLVSSGAAASAAEAFLGGAAE